MPICVGENEKYLKDQTLVTEIEVIDTENKFPNLYKFKTYLESTPLRDQKIVDDLEIIQKEALLEAADELLECLSDCHVKLKSAISPGEQISISPVLTQHASRFTKKDFQDYLSVRARSDALHTLLKQQWGCLCSTGHEGQLGIYTDVKLRLQADWMRNGKPPKDFDLVFYGKHVFPQDCKVVLETDLLSPLQQRQISQLCRIPLKQLAGMQLDICVVPLNEPVTLEYGTKKESGLTLPCDPATDETPSMTLRELLDLAEKRILTMRIPERRILGIIVAHSLLHLLNGQWIQDSWDEVEISFYSYGTDNQAQPFYNWRRPYLSLCLGNSSTELDAQESSSDIRHPNPGMFTLGLKLLQLELGHAGSYAVPDISIPKYIRAMRLLNELKRLNSDKTEFDLVLKSIECCIKMDTYVGKDGPELAWHIYEEVIKPLEQDLFAMKINAITGSPGSLFEDLISGVSPKDAMIVNETIGWTGIPHGGKTLNVVADNWYKKLIEETEPLMQAGHSKTYGLKKKILSLDPFDRQFNSQVKIAILDTGIDLTHPMLKDHISQEDCYDFVDGCEGITDLAGHGTHTVSLLLKTAPRARIFGARVMKYMNADGSTAQNIVDALDKAINVWKVDIVTISIALQDADEDIVEQIENAKYKKVLVFAAASNDGSLNPKALGFPARDRDVICVYSSKTPEIGSAFSPKGKRNKPNLSTIGEEVEGAWPINLDPASKGIKRCDGTSMATPIVAGAAALILEYANQAGHTKVEKPEKLKKKDVMEQVLLHCMTGRAVNGEYNFVKPWQLLVQSDEKTPKKISDEISNRIKIVLADQ